MENNNIELDLEKDLTPQEYFDMLKSKKNQITDEDLQAIYNQSFILANKYFEAQQVKGLKKLLFHMDTIELEREIVAMGIDTYIYRDVIDYYIDNVAEDVVKIIELENYEREIPDEIVEIIKKTKDKFTDLYVLFTDYTGKEERKVQKERRDKDPILFGTFQDKKSKSVVDRFYFLGDWQDEYCDLTLDKMVNQIKDKDNSNILRKISTPHTIEELREQLKLLEIKKNNKIIMNVKEEPKEETETKEKIKPSFFVKMITFFKSWLWF